MLSTDAHTTDAEIAALVGEEKPLPENWASRLQLRAKANARHGEAQFEVVSVQGNRFRVTLRRSLMNLLDFSVILHFVDEAGHLYRLIRYNGRHPSQHTNKWEKAHRQPNAAFRNVFHIHRATERYIEAYGVKAIDGYAEETDRYQSYETAIQAFLDDNGFKRPPEASGQLGLFEQ